jgi:DNA-binding XRE family transcriptional regulator
MHLQQYLFKKKIHLGDFAKSIGVSRKTLYMIVNGKTDPRLSIVRKIEELTHGQVTAKDIEITSYKPH